FVQTFLKRQINYSSAFQRHGYIVLRSAFSGVALDRLRLLADFLEAAPEIAGRWMKYFELGPGGTRLLNRVEAFLEHCPEAPAVFDNPAMHEAVFAAFGRPYVLFKEKLNLKPAGGGGYAPHQDAPAWRLLTQEAVSVMVAVDETTAENGALQVDCEFACGRTLLPHSHGQLVDACSISWEALYLLPGDAVVFSAFLPHQSSPNRSRSHRRAFFLTYNASEEGDLREVYFAHKRRVFPPEIERADTAAVAGWRSRLARELL
ncbi:phytanoyl-CoA dioxygenase family protein, partial [Xanthomonas axonopodis pv. begoniae]|nr:phytanoyl-CoA dioxygenase family protein [Xanthomonas axonopodis pv. begoniae]MBO9771997.1 phytanoyl-CoA dioxygenase family protein [Xanthomonas axonopodis pv. begoniae]